MNAVPFSTQVPGKWVLAGEHTVLRGGAAIALPHPEFHLRLDFRPAPAGREEFSVEPGIADPIVRALIETASHWLSSRNVAFRFPHGLLTITSTIPFGAGLGSSAALSVAIARWMLKEHDLEAGLERDLAREMEDRFHGRSSGLDVAAVSLAEPILFTMAEGAVPLRLTRLPKFSFVDTGIRASTRECVEKVEAIRRADPEKMHALDEEMIRATDEVLAGLRSYSASAERATRPALDLIARGMERSRAVFAAWELEPEAVGAVFSALEKAGVRSPRLTGAGGGGFVVGLIGE